MLERCLDLLTGTMEGLLPSVFPLIYIILVFVLCVCILFLPIIISSVLYSLLDNLIKSNKNNAIMVLGGVVQVVWLISAVNYMWNN